MQAWRGVLGTSWLTYHAQVTAKECIGFESIPLVELRSCSSEGLRSHGSMNWIPGQTLHFDIQKDVPWKAPSSSSSIQSYPILISSKTPLNSHKVVSNAFKSPSEVKLRCICVLLSCSFPFSVWVILFHVMYVLIPDFLFMSLRRA